MKTFITDSAVVPSTPVGKAWEAVSESFDRFCLAAGIEALDVAHDPASLIRPYPADEMTAWPISTRVNRPENADPGILDRIELSLSPHY